MPTVAAATGVLRVWALAPVPALGALAPVGNLVQQAIDRRVEALATQPLRNSYTDTGRSEQHDEHRKALVEEIKALSTIDEDERLKQLQIELLELELQQKTEPAWEFFTS